MGGAALAPMKIEYSELSMFYQDSVMDAALRVASAKSFLWHVAMPKSGTTWVSKIFAHLVTQQGGEVGQLVPDHATRPQEIDPRRFITPSASAVFFRQQHCLWSRYTERLVGLTGTKILFQYRDLLDAMLSLHDHIEDALFGTGVERHTQPKGIWQLERSEILDYVIDVRLPWYCLFLDGWLQSDLSKSQNFYAMSYEALVASPTDELRKAVEALELNYSKQQISEAVTAVEQGFTRKNKGVVGRGASAFSAEQMQRVRRTVGHFKSLAGLVRSSR